MIGPATKAKTSRSYRLLIADDHGLHITIDFFNYCTRNSIRLATHELQVVLVVQGGLHVRAAPLLSKSTLAMIKGTNNLDYEEIRVK